MSAVSSGWLHAGRVASAHGLDGSFYVAQPNASLLSLGATIRIAGQERRITRRAGTDLRPIVRIEDCADRAGAEARLASSGIAIEARTEFTLYFRDPDGRRIGLSHYPETS